MIDLFQLLIDHFVKRSPLPSLVWVALLTVLLGACTPDSSDSLDLPDNMIVPPPFITPTYHPIPTPKFVYYVSTASGDDSNPGTKTLPWRTYKKALAVAPENSLIYILGGVYSSEGADFLSNNVTVTNYPGEQVIIQLKEGSSQAFNCWSIAGHGAKTDIRIMGSDVPPQMLPNGVMSSKGITVIGFPGSQDAGFLAHGGCDRWEIAGIDFIDVGHAIFTLKETYSQVGNLSADGWYVHDNRVYGFYKETGMQFNGNDNLIENNEIVKVSPVLSTPFGCYLLNLLGHGNVVRENTLTGLTGTNCRGILFEWSQSDANLVENNMITDVTVGIEFRGGDNNLIRNNIIVSAPHDIQAKKGGVEVYSYSETYIDWPCTDYTGSHDENPLSLIPPEDPAHPDYAYYYPYGECQSYGNQFIGNKISGFSIGIKFDSYLPTIGQTLITDNDISGWILGSICIFRNEGCRALP